MSLSALSIRKRCIRAAGCFALLVFLNHALIAEARGQAFTDPLDGRLDASRWLLDRRGFLPVPIVITEPSVGYGGGLALAFFHRNKDISPPPNHERSRAFTQPSVSVAMAAMRVAGPAASVRVICSRE